VVIHPPVALFIGTVAGFGLNWLYPLPFVPLSVPRDWIGVALFLAGIFLAAWSARTFRKAHTNILISQSANTIVTTGPYAFSRNPIYVGMFLGLAGLAIGFNTLWFLAVLVAMAFVIRYGVIAREEIYLEAKFGAHYLDYKARVRRWL
jgi:protein-S-isoprenylcysteine O-methyltransferase Ste14